MITGFNTDVKHKAKVFHVQTEDKGRENPKIETLVYLGGQILDSIKVPYQNDPPLSEATISDMMEAQHKRIIRNIKIGKFDEPGDDTWELGDLSLDEAVLQYLAEHHAQDKIEISVSGLDQLQPDLPCVLVFQIRNAANGTPVERARIRTKILCQNSAPKVLNQGETVENGQLELPITLPKEIFNSGCSLKFQIFSESGVAEKQFPLA